MKPDATDSYTVTVGHKALNVGHKARRYRGADLFVEGVELTHA